MNKNYIIDGDDGSSCQSPYHTDCSRCNPMTPVEYKGHVIEKDTDGTVIWYPVNDREDVSRAYSVEEAKDVIDMICKL